MSRTIWKFTVPVSDRPVILMDAVLVRWLHVECAGPDMITVWALVRPSAEGRARRYPLVVHGTGHPVSEGVGRHVGSVSWRGTGVLVDAVLVWHVFAVAGTELEMDAAA
ncbi:DUF7352 domain-containing protein [Tsukamurella tyrosinosolvens]|uniref:DUF7352 domain-containing protein n=1 Tax=Tsukamurella tyrosinosolvens TaxID=57704 RepID=UPI002DD44533|nr:hypothetical protein [Tsukamurella tyrosinosolvens]MEC4616272.1 hypothetical protein [Tsukamurella tyrosinosolvens]